MFQHCHAGKLFMKYIQSKGNSYTVQLLFRVKDPNYILLQNRAIAIWTTPTPSSKIWSSSAARPSWGSLPPCSQCWCTQKWLPSEILFSSKMLYDIDVFWPDWSNRMLQQPDCSLAVAVDLYGPTDVKTAEDGPTLMSKLRRSVLNHSASFTACAAAIYSASDVDTAR